MVRQRMGLLVPLLGPDQTLRGATLSKSRLFSATTTNRLLIRGKKRVPGFSI